MLPLAFFSSDPLSHMGTGVPGALSVGRHDAACRPSSPVIHARRRYRWLGTSLSFSLPVTWLPGRFETHRDTRRSS